jgi:Ion channel
VAFGTHLNFSHSLTHLDAAYFMAGTLTTAGTGSLNAISETAQAIQFAQFCIDFLLVVLSVSLIGTRCTEYRSRRKDRAESDNRSRHPT